MMNRPFLTLLRGMTALLVVLLLSGCGTYYTVSVDSLRAEKPGVHPDTYYLLPGDADVPEDDLLFREICRILAPAFAARGYTVVANRTEARNTVHIWYGEEAPRTVFSTEIMHRSVPVISRGKDGRQVEYVTVAEPVVTASTLYTARLLITAIANAPKGNKQPLWRTSVTCSSSQRALRTLIAAMVPALAETLGTRTDGNKTFEVFVDDKGKMSMDALD